MNHAHSCLRIESGNVRCMSEIPPSLRKQLGGATSVQVFGGWFDKVDLCKGWTCPAPTKKNFTLHHGVFPARPNLLAHQGRSGGVVIFNIGAPAAINLPHSATQHMPPRTPSLHPPIRSTKRIIDQTLTTPRSGQANTDLKCC